MNTLCGSSTYRPLEWCAVAEAEALVQSTRRLERILRSGFEAESRVLAAPGHPDDVLEHGSCHSGAASPQRGSHGLDLAMARIEFLQRAAAEQFCA